MNSSLRDQLLAAGLVTEKQARKAAQQEEQRLFRDRPRPKVAQGGGHQKGHKHQQGHPKGQGTARPPVQAAAPSLHDTTAPATLLAQQAQAAKVARDMELNRRREEKAQRRARLAEIEQIIEQNRLPRLETEDHYSFLDGKKIRRMSVDPDRREKLTSGALGIVRYKGHYAVVPAATAERIRERDANMVVPMVQASTGATAEDEAYKDFVVPDDLMW